MNLDLNWCGPHLDHGRKAWASGCIDKGAALLGVGLIPINDKLFCYDSLILNPVLCVCYLLHDAGSQGGFLVSPGYKTGFEQF